MESAESIGFSQLWSNFDSNAAKYTFCHNKNTLLTISNLNFCQAQEHRKPLIGYKTN